MPSQYAYCVLEDRMLLQKGRLEKDGNFGVLVIKLFSKSVASVWSSTLKPSFIPILYSALFLSILFSLSLFLSLSLLLIHFWCSIENVVYRPVIDSSAVCEFLLEKVKVHNTSEMSVLVVVSFNMNESLKLNLKYFFTA